MAKQTGSESELRPQLTDKVALAFFKLPTNFLSSWRKQFELEFLQCIADVLGVGECVANSANIVDNLCPNPGEVSKLS